MSYIPGAGLKKPLNMVEGPVYPDIKKAPPRFVNSGKYWRVDEGRTLRDLESERQFYENAVLVQSRDYNKTRYGQHSHKSVVNKAFRPPLLTQEDTLPLSRLPRKIVVPRINPGTADSSTPGFTSKNGRVTEIGHYLTDRVKKGEIRPTFFCPIDMPDDNSVLPDLEMKIPMIPLDPRMNTPMRIDAAQREVHLDHSQYDPKMQSGYNATTLISGPSGMENIELYDNRPSYAVSAGMNGFAVTNLDEILLPELSDNRPAYSASAGMNNITQLNAYTPLEELELEEKIRRNDFAVNPVFDFDGTDYSLQDSRMKVGDNRPSYSYANPGKTNVSASNYLTHRPHFKEKLKVPGGYENRGYMPRSGIEVQNIQLKATDAPIAKKIVHYRI